MDKIAFILRTRSLKSDDRLLKEIKSCTPQYDAISVYALTNDNEDKTYPLADKVMVHELALRTRNMKTSPLVDLMRSAEFYLKLRKRLKAYDTVWCCDEETFIFLLMVKNRMKVWDLHELPIKIYSKPFGKKLLSMLERKSDLIVHANDYRKDYLLEESLFQQGKKHTALRNYPDGQPFVDYEPDQAFAEWEAEYPKYCYLQGINQAERFPLNSVKAILENEQLGLVIVGSVHESVKAYMKTLDAASHKRLYLTGFINQADIPRYVQNAYCSIILYAPESPNTLYCEPNRLFYAIKYGVPIVVGKNPPMKDIIDKHGNGIVLGDYGEAMEPIGRAISDLTQNEAFRTKAKEIKDTYLWENQKFPVLAKQH